MGGFYLQFFNLYSFLEQIKTEPRVESISLFIQLESEKMDKKYVGMAALIIMILRPRESNFLFQWATFLSSPPIFSAPYQ